MTRREILERADEEREKLDIVNKELSKFDNVRCEYYFDIDDDDAPVLIIHQKDSFVPLFILRPQFHSMLDMKDSIMTNIDIDEFWCWEDACYKGTEDNEFIMKFYNEVEKIFTA